MTRNLEPVAELLLVLVQLSKLNLNLLHSLGHFFTFMDTHYNQYIPFLNYNSSSIGTRNKRGFTKALNWGPGTGLVRMSA